MTMTITIMVSNRQVDFFKWEPLILTSEMERAENFTSGNFLEYDLDCDFQDHLKVKLIYSY